MARPGLEPGTPRFSDTSNGAGDTWRFCSTDVALPQARQAAEIRADTCGFGGVLATKGRSVAITLRRVGSGHRPALRSSSAPRGLHPRTARPDGHGPCCRASGRAPDPDCRRRAGRRRRAARRSPWVPAAELRRIQGETPADHRLLGDLGDVRALVPSATSGGEWCAAARERRPGFPQRLPGRRGPERRAGSCTGASSEASSRASRIRARS